MLEKADRKITEVIKAFAEYGAEAEYLVPTDTGMKKSIMDAHAQLRDYLKSRNIHDYKTQTQGLDNKVLLNGWMVLESEKIPVQISLYRPDSKSGDPRIWVYGLKKYAAPYNLLALIESKGELYVINTSDSVVFSTINKNNSPLNQLVKTFLPEDKPAAAELLEKLKIISSQGYIKSMRKGSTGIGMTLETLLGIPANSKKAPDYKGIEIKSSRTTKKKPPRSRVTLYGKAPNWKASKVKNAAGLLSLLGYPDKKTGLQRLTCSVSIKPNSQGLFFTLNEKDQILEICYKDQGVVKSTVCWKFETIKICLKDKHGHTFWVMTDVKKTDGHEEFHYYEALETKAPLLENYIPLIELGIVTLDFTISTKTNKSGAHYIKDHGYLFKIKHKDFDLLFSACKAHSLIK